LYAYYHNLTELDHNLVINHINGNKEDNRKENLELVTVTENNRHALNKLGKDRTPNRKLTDEQVLVIRKELSKGVKQVELSKRFGVTRTTISYISKNKCWKSEVLV
jgi:predicted DNA binding protein